jgi:hypothetical protein
VDVLALPGSTRLSPRTGHRRCARCGKVVSRRALVCRRCGKQQRVNPRSVMLLVAGVFLIALFSFATANPRLPFGRLRGEAPTPAESVPPPRAPATGDPSVITAIELWAAYEANPAQADARFNGKPVSVTGTITDVRRDYLGDIVLRFKTGETLEGVRATVVSRLDSRSMPTRGQVVSLRCTGGGTIIGAPILTACRPF